MGGEDGRRGAGLVVLHSTLLFSSSSLGIAPFLRSLCKSSLFILLCPCSGREPSLQPKQFQLATAGTAQQEIAKARLSHRASASFNARTSGWRLLRQSPAYTTSGNTRARRWKLPGAKRREQLVRKRGRLDKRPTITHSTAEHTNLLLTPSSASKSATPSHAIRQTQPSHPPRPQPH